MTEQAPADHNKSPEAEIADHIYGTMRQIADTAILTGYDVTDRVYDEYTGNPERTKHIALGSYDVYPHVEISLAQTQEAESLGEEPAIYIHLYHSELPDNDKYFDEHGEPLFDEDNEDEEPKAVDVLCTQYKAFEDDADEDVDPKDRDRIVLKFEENFHFDVDDGYYEDADVTLLNEIESKFPVSIEELEKLYGIVAGLLQKAQSGPESKQ
jgi:hypothetical protein